MNKLVALVVTLALASVAAADVRLPGVISDNMIIQRDQPIHVWGWAAEGEAVTVTLGEQSTKTAAKDGRWSVKLPAMKAGGPLTLTVAGANKLEVKNILIGDIWVCCGQSNMMFSLSNATGGAQAAAEANNYPNIRLLTVPGPPKADAPADDIKAKWTPATPATVPGFSAVGYFFGRQIAATQKVPVGLINCVAIVPCHAWVEPNAVKSHPDLAPFQKDPLIHAGDSFNAMIAPLTPLPIRGAIYYQGEYDAGRSQIFRKMFPALIASWRQAWGVGDFPFLFVQLAAFDRHDPNAAAQLKGLDMAPSVLEALKKPGADSGWAALRQAQFLTLQSVPNTGMAVAIDVGEPLDIHPKNKQPVGERLALWARAVAYGEKIEPSGPLYDRAEFSGPKAVVHFTHVGKGLIARGEKLEGFAIAGADGNFVWGDARIEGNTVVVTHPQVAAPAAVRYGWANYPLCNLYNADGLPASPFASDRFPRKQSLDEFTLPFRNGCFEEPAAAATQPAGWKVSGATRDEAKPASGKAALHYPPPAATTRPTAPKATGDVYQNFSPWDNRWTADLTDGPYHSRPGTVYYYSLKAAATADGNVQLHHLLNMQMFGYHQNRVAGGEYKTFRAAGVRTRDGAMWQMGLEFRMFTMGELFVDDFDGIHWLRARLGLSDANAIDLGVVAAGKTVDSAARTIFNAQPKVGMNEDKLIATILYGAGHLRAPADPNIVWMQTSDDVGAEILGDSAALFEFVTEHKGDSARSLKLIGADGKAGLVGGETPESEPLVLRFLGADKPGKYSATLRLCTTAGNLGTVSQGRPGEPMANLFYLDIPVTVTVK